MNNLFTIDPGFDSEILEIEEFMNRKKVVNVELKLQCEFVPKTRIIVATKEASKLFLPLKKTLLGEFFIGSSNLSKPGEGKGVGVYEIDGEIVVLMGSIDEDLMGFYIREIIKKVVSKDCIVLDIKPTVPDNDESFKIFTTNDTNKGFELFFGSAAALLNELRARNLNGNLLMIPKNGNALASFNSGMKQIGLNFNFKQSDLKKVLLHPNGFSSMFI